MRNIFLLMVLFRATPPVCMYPTGADLSACVTMEPNHGGNTATGDAPYRFTISQADGSPATEYTIGQILTIRIAPNPGESFKGFLLKAVQRAQTGAVGSFDTSDTTQTACGSGLTHVNSGLHTWTYPQSLSVNWTAPRVPRGPLDFFVTIVKERNEYWVKVTPDGSTTLQDVSLRFSSIGNVVVIHWDGSNGLYDEIYIFTDNIPARSLDYTTSGQFSILLDDIFDNVTVSASTGTAEDVYFPLAYFPHRNSTEFYPVCDVGYFLNTAVVPSICSPCPADTYKDSTGDGLCINCLGGETTNGLTAATNCMNIDECASSPCKNGGTCINGLNSFTCQCKICLCSDTYHIDATCNIDEDFCEVNQQNIYHSHPTNCERYIYCNAQFVVDLYCAGGTVYDLPSGQCKIRDEVFCAQDPADAKFFPLSESDVSETDIRLRWLAKPNVTPYQLLVKNQTRFVEAIYHTNQSEMTIEGLMPGREYSFILKTSSEANHSAEVTLGTPMF